MDLTKRKDAGLVRQVEALCTAAGVEIVRTSRHELNLMSHDRPHQGLVLDVSPLSGPRWTSSAGGPGHGRTGFGCCGTWWRWYTVRQLHRCGWPWMKSLIR
ncbi:hypothetical protein Vretifemale_13035 [Volvox reticuliferus]|uniref:RNA 2-O ribose methyltransferase substrate binding domain-containing protein n=1 Tax=Volvox reticuliferus TaxID=1737510 RepID=A0A8J4CNC4_9CHLO|nr:hypothetical protein Vretifemale_13035 [Volvox reticuliferus]